MLKEFDEEGRNNLFLIQERHPHISSRNVTWSYSGLVLQVSTPESIKESQDNGFDVPDSTPLVYRTYQGVPENELVGLRKFCMGYK